MPTKAQRAKMYVCKNVFAVFRLLRYQINDFLVDTGIFDQIGIHTPVKENDISVICRLLSLSGIETLGWISDFFRRLGLHF